MSELSKRRKVRAGGRPRSNAQRCPCGAMTLKRAQARGRTFEHETFCPFYKGRAI
jgi:hypothetical protein